MSEDYAGLTSDAKAYNKQPGTLCAVTVFLRSLNPDDKRRVEQALDNRDLSHAGIYHALRKRLGDDAPSAWSVGRHRRGDCTCSKGGE